MVDPWIDGTADPVHADVGNYMGPIAAVFAGGEWALRNQLSLYRKSRQRPRIKPADRLLWCFIAKFWEGLARSPVLCSAQDRNDLAEKSIPRLLARAQSVS